MYKSWRKTLTNDVIIYPRSTERKKPGKIRERQERADVYSEVISLSLFVFTIPTFQTSNLRVEDSNPSPSVRKIKNLQF